MDQYYDILISVLSRIDLPIRHTVKSVLPRLDYGFWRCFRERPFVVQ